MISKSNHVLSIMNAPRSYKPKLSEVKLHDELEDLRLQLFKGIEVRVTRMRGPMLEVVNDFIVAQTEEVSDSQLRERTAEKVMRAYVDNVEDMIVAGKRRFFKSGMLLKNAQILKTVFVHPVPHVKGMSIVLATLDLLNYETKEFWMRSSFWSMYFDDNVVPFELQEYYSNHVTLESRLPGESLADTMVRLFFEVVPPQQVA